MSLVVFSALLLADLLTSWRGQDVISSTDDDNLFNICDCCIPDSGGTVSETFFAIFEVRARPRPRPSNPVCLATCRE